MDRVLKAQQSLIAALLRLAVLLCLMAIAGTALPGRAQAQTVNRYTNTTDSANNAINDTATPCSPETSRFSRTFSVGSSFIVSDVNIGILMAHTWRADVQMFLVSPTGTRVQLTTGLGGNADNFNLTFDDEAGSGISGYTANATAAASTVVPPYAASYRPTSALSAFDGQNAAGTWRLEICDAAAQDSGTFFQADLYLTQAVISNFADLSLAMSVSNTAPVSGSNISITMTVANAPSSPNAASGIVVRNLLPAGLSFVSASGSGTYNPATGDWTVGTLAPGQNAALTIIATVLAGNGTGISLTGEITGSSIADIDSTPNNGIVGEDDQASISITATGSRSAGTAPILTCMAGTIVFDWDAQSWSAGSTSNSYNLPGIGQVAFTIANPGTFLSNATYGGQSPTRQSVVTGGLAPAQSSLMQLVDLSSTSQTVDTTITLGTAVPKAQFTIFDVDYFAGQFADRVTVSGYYNGVLVTPVLTNGISNYVSGNSAFGDALSADSEVNGNVVVTFNDPIDTIVIQYGNHGLAPANPGQQAVTLHDITFCRPVGTISATKLSSVLSDPVNGGSYPKAIPGALIEYCILLTNTGSATATSVTATDVLPANFTYLAGSLTSGANCASATTIEDENATGADENDPFGASISAGTLTATASSLGASASFAIKFRGTLN